MTDPTQGADTAAYRCGYCGQPCDSEGEPIEPGMSLDYDRAEMVQGECCRAEQMERPRVQVTREMAMDGGMPEMEGQWIEW